MVEDVADPDGRATLGQCGIERPDIGGQGVVGTELGEAMNQTMTNLSPGAGHQHHRLARHADPVSKQGARAPRH